ncbi:patatin-like phospholipase family protein [Bacillaceae bacterium W0354]
MEVDGVFSGGGVKAFAFLGALDVCEQKNITFKRLAGTSAGALLASLVIAGYRFEELTDILSDVQTKNFLDQHPLVKKIPLLKWLLLFHTLGLYRGDQLEDWVDYLLRQKGVRTFGDLEDNQLFIIGTDVTNGRLAIFPNDLEDYYGIDPNKFPIAKAVRISVSIPYFFKPVVLKSKHNYSSVMIDGGTLSNFPYWIFKGKSDKKVRPTLGIKSSARQISIPKQQVNNAVDMLQAIFHTVLQAHDSRYVSDEDAKDIIFIPIEDVSAIDFDLTENEKEYLIRVGRLRAESFFKKWQK